MTWLDDVSVVRLTRADLLAATTASSPWACLPTLPRAERERCAERRRSDRLMSRLAVRRALRHAGLEADGEDSVELRRCANGRPELWLDGVNVDALTAPICIDRYSVSTSFDREVGVGAAVAVPAGSVGRIIGVDVVSAGRMGRWDAAHVAGLAQRVLGPDEDPALCRSARDCAAMIAAKEAIGKATRHLDPTLRWRDVAVGRPDTSGTRRWWVRSNDSATGAVRVVCLAGDVVAVALHAPADQRVAA